MNMKASKEAVWASVYGAEYVYWLEECGRSVEDAEAKAEMRANQAVEKLGCSGSKDTVDDTDTEIVFDDEGSVSIDDIYVSPKFAGLVTVGDGNGELCFAKHEAHDLIRLLKAFLKEHN